MEKFIFSIMTSITTYVQQHSIEIHDKEYKWVRK